MFGFNTFGRWFVSGNVSIALMFLAFPIGLRGPRLLSHALCD
jgi:hypothetical protein